MMKFVKLESHVVFTRNFFTNAEVDSKNNHVQNDLLNSIYLQIALSLEGYSEKNDIFTYLIWSETYAKSALGKNNYVQIMSHCSKKFLRQIVSISYP